MEPYRTPRRRYILLASSIILLVMIGSRSARLQRSYPRPIDLEHQVRGFLTHLARPYFLAAAAMLLLGAATMPTPLAALRDKAARAEAEEKYLRGTPALFPATQRQIRSRDG